MTATSTSEVPVLKAAGTPVPRRRRRDRLPLTPVERTLRWLLYIVVAAVLAFLVGPIVIVVLESFNKVAYLSFPLKGWSTRWYHTFFGDPSWRAAIWQSLRLAIMSSIIATVLGTAAAWSLSRRKPRGGGLIYAFLFSPLIVPLIVLAMSYYFFFSSLHLIGNQFAIAAAYSVMAIPLVLVVVSGALQHVDPELEKAARTLGAGPVRALMRITLPQIGSAIGAGAVFAFVMSFDEAVVILFVSGSGTITLPRKLWDSVRYDLDPTLAVAGTVLIGTSIGLFILAELFGAVRDRRRRRL